MAFPPHFCVPTNRHTCRVFSLPHVCMHASTQKEFRLACAQPEEAGHGCLQLRGTWHPPTSSKQRPDVSSRSGDSRKTWEIFFSTGQAVERLSLGLIISGCTWEESVQRWGKERLVSDRNNRAIPDNFTWSGEVIFKCYTKGCFDSHLVSCSCSLQCYSRFWNPGCSV